MAENYVKVIGEATGAKAQNAEWFASDLQEQQISEQFGASKFRLTLAISTEKKVQITLDSGTTWVYLNEANALTADALYMFDIGVRSGDNFNMRCDEASGTTIRICRVSEVSMEG